MGCVSGDWEVSGDRDSPPRGSVGEAFRQVELRFSVAGGCRPVENGDTRRGAQDVANADPRKFGRGILITQ